MRPVFALILLGVAGVATATLPAAAQEARQASRTYQVGSFSAVALAGSHNVIVTQGRSHSVRAMGAAETLDRLEIDVHDGGLRIREKRNLLPRYRSLPAATIHVTTPALRAASVAGSGDMRIDRVEGASFSGSVAGSGDLDIAAMRVGEASFSIAGSGDIRAAGTAGAAKVRIAGSGNAELGRLQARTADIQVMGSGDVRLRGGETAAVSIMGSGNVVVDGPAKCTVRTRGSGRVRCNG